MPAHTPGKWVVREWPCPNIDGPFLKLGIRHLSAHMDGGEFCTVEAMHTTAEAQETARANARLIAAAPEMLDLLTEAAEIVPTTPRHAANIKRIRALLARLGAR